MFPSLLSSSNSRSYRKSFNLSMTIVSFVQTSSPSSVESIVTNRSRVVISTKWRTDIILIDVHVTKYVVHRGDDSVHIWRKCQSWHNCKAAETYRASCKLICQAKFEEDWITSVFEPSAQRLSLTEFLNIDNTGASDSDIAIAVRYLFLKKRSKTVTIGSRSDLISSLLWSWKRLDILSLYICMTRVLEIYRVTTRPLSSVCKRTRSSIQRDTGNHILRSWDTEKDTRSRSRNASDHAHHWSDEINIWDLSDIFVVIGIDWW